MRSDKIATLIKSGVSSRVILAMLFAKMAEKRNATHLIMNAGAGGEVVHRLGSLHAGRCGANCLATRRRRSRKK
ncbi:hypothetical protein Bca52824_006141 [Brassica carinata]|uniref:Uncharacterized protein n=1 Tax=Brassica carinata TaxID=52824 RepID=A0A8X7WS11_BRACI|nr:hypothetical protein Bca52824_006141 [Brassica carinata]